MTFNNLGNQLRIGLKRRHHRPCSKQAVLLQRPRISLSRHRQLFFRNKLPI
ncbi:hypothetical protein ES703_68064 [subsurface metagenome]